ncbi:MAG: DUF7344 domain-containing protein [Halobacteriota archaeon]
MGTAGDTTSDVGTAGRTGDGVSQEQLDNLIDDKRQSGEQLPLDDIFDLLRNQRRRGVLRYLRDETDGTATLDELAEHIAAKENDIEISQLTSSQRKRVYIGLYQCHLPKMDELGIIAYDQNRGTIELRDISQLEPFLAGLEGETETEAERPLIPIYVASAVGIVVIAGILDVGPLAIAPAEIWAILSTVALFAVALYQYR